MKNVLLPLAGALVLAGCDAAVIPPATGANAYEYRLAVQPPQVLRWPSASTIRIYVAESDAELRTALEAGMAAWNRHALFGEYRLVETSELGAADVVLRWSTETGSVDISGCLPSGPRAVTTFCGAGGDILTGLEVFPRVDGGSSRVKMVVTVISTQGGDQARVNGLVAHELGHVLGIMRHSTDARDLMYDQVLVAAPSVRDVATVRLLYQMVPEIEP